MVGLLSHGGNFLVSTPITSMGLFRYTVFLIFLTLYPSLSSAQLLTAVGGHLSGVNIECNSNNILVTISTNDDFNGMIYPKGLSKNSSCLMEYEHAGSKITYALPLRSCNTMSHDVNEGIEYFNTVVVQPHHKLVTSYGKGFHIRCRYQTKNKTITSNVGINSIGTTPMIQSAPMPVCTMKIYVGNSEKHIAEHVKIGDYLTLVISIEEQAVYGMKVTNCIVKDGLNWAEQPLVNNDGCPIDEEIMGPFDYTKNLTTATVTYPAHKFPFTSSVYYQCNVKLCLKQGGCEDTPPICDPSGHNVLRRRRRRQSGNEVKDQGSLIELRRQEEDSRDHSVEVFSGLYVNEVDDADDDSDSVNSQASRSEDDFCVSTRKFAIGIAIAGVLLMLAVFLLVACIVHRRRRRKTSSTAGSSIYSGPYSNHAYSRD